MRRDANLCNELCGLRKFVQVFHLMRSHNRRLNLKKSLEKAAKMVKCVKYSLEKMDRVILRKKEINEMKNGAFIFLPLVAAIAHACDVLEEPMQGPWITSHHISLAITKRGPGSVAM